MSAGPPSFTPEPPAPRGTDRRVPRDGGSRGTRHPPGGPRRACRMITTWWGLVLLTIGSPRWPWWRRRYAAHRVGRVSVVDVTWGLALAAIAVAAAVVGTGTPWRRWLVAGLVLVWGVRLVAAHLHPSAGRWRGPALHRAAGRRWLPGRGDQGLPDPGADDLPGRPAGPGRRLPRRRRDLAGLGRGGGLGRGPALRGRRRRPAGVVQVGPRPRVRSWTAACGAGPVIPTTSATLCLWWGIWLVGGAASGWLPALVTVASPLAMTHFLRNVTGAKLLEETMSQRPGWDAYAARVPLFVPRPPRRPHGGRRSR